MLTEERILTYKHACCSGLLVKVVELGTELPATERRVAIHN